MNSRGVALRSWFGRHPVLKAAIGSLLAPLRGGASRAYRRLGAAESASEGVALRGAWQAEGIPAQQRRLVDQQLSALRSGAEIPAFETLVRLLRPLVASFRSTAEVSLLEIGCSSGYHSEIFEYRRLGIAYHGCDYSTAFVRMARQCYPSLPFTVADATSLPMPDGSIDIVLLGCCLLHIPEYEAAIRESARIARRYVVFHRTPVLHNSATTYYRKRAYDVETIEIHFNEEEFVALLAKHGLHVIAVATLDVAWKTGAMYATKEYVCEKYNLSTAMRDDAN